VVPAIFRRAAREDGVWGVLAAAGTAAVLLAALALTLDLAAMANARTEVQSALDSALTSAARDVLPSSIASTHPVLAGASAEADASASLGAALPGTIGYRWLNPPTVQAGPPASIAASIAVTVTLPAVGGDVTFPVGGREAIGWLPH